MRGVARGHLNAQGTTANSADQWRPANRPGQGRAGTVPMSAGQQSSDGYCCNGVSRWPGRCTRGTQAAGAPIPILAATRLDADPGHVWGGLLDVTTRAHWGFLGVSAGIAHAHARDTARLPPIRRGGAAKSGQPTADTARNR